MEDYGREDREYWSMKYAEAECHRHGDTMYWEEEEGEWVCYECTIEDDLERIYKYG